MGRRYKVQGPPGTGKTTYLSIRAAKMLASGVRPTDISVCSFTRAAAFRSRSTVAKAAGLQPEDLPWVGTMHSLCYQLLDQKSENKVGTKHLKPLFESLHIPYKPPKRPRDATPDLYVDSEEQPADKGSWFLGFWDWFRSTRWIDPYRYAKSDEVIRDAVRSYPGGFRACGNDRGVATIVALRCWQPYERLLNDLGLWDFARLVELAIERQLRPPCKVLMVDECQDLSPMLWQLARQWADKSTGSWFAGDPYQAIYTFAGSHPRFFYELDAELVSLVQCHRFGNDRIRLAKNVLKGDPSFLDFEWVGRDSDGRGYTDGSASIIGRTRSIIAEHCAELRRRGIPYESNRAPTLIKSKAARAVYGGMALAEDGSVSMADLAAFTALIPVDHHPWLKRGEARKKIGQALVTHGANARVRADELINLGVTDELRALMERGQPWDALVKIDKDDRAYFEAVCLRAGREALVADAKLFVTTIHGAKGLEWDVTTTELDWARNPHQAYQGSGRGEECRVGYVGVTRARHDQLFNFSGGNCFPPLSGFR